MKAGNVLMNVADVNRNLGRRACDLTQEGETSRSAGVVCSYSEGGCSMMIDHSDIAKRCKTLSQGCVFALLALVT